MEKKELSYKTQVNRRYFLNGICWLVSGVCNCFEGKVSAIISIIALALGTFFLISTFVKNRQAPDEMADSNLYKAVSYSFWIGQIVIFVFYVIFNSATQKLIGIKMDLNQFFPGFLLAFLGLFNIIAGIIFKKLEEE